MIYHILSLYSLPLMESKNDLSPQAEAILHRIADWQNPSLEEFTDIRAIESIWVQLVYSILTHCPDNSERQQALMRLEEAKFWARNSITRLSECDER